MASRRRRWTGVALVLALIATFATAGMAARITPSYLDLPIKRLPARGSPKESATLGQLCKSNSSVVVYAWQADRKDLEAGPVDGSSKVWRVARAELDSLRGSLWDLGAHKVISMVSVWSNGGPGTQAEREDVYRNIQEMARSAAWDLDDPVQMPLYVDATNAYEQITHTELAEAVVAASGERRLKPPLLFQVQDVDGQVKLRVRGNSPIRAASWVKSLGAPSRGDDSEWAIPSDYRDSFFRHHIARVLGAGVLQPKHAESGGSFKPKEFMTEQGFLDALAAISGRDRTVFLTIYKPDLPMTRERAIEATANAIYGSETADACSKPADPDNAANWQQALEGFPGSRLISGGIDKSRLQLALAKGLIYYEPALRPDDPIRRDEAAWLLAHALVRHGTESLPDDAGLLIDAIDVPITPYRSQHGGEIYVEGGGKAPTRIYPPTETERLPTPPDSYSPALFIDQMELGQAARGTQAGGDPDTKVPANVTNKEGWLHQRVGLKPLVIRARDVLGPGRLACSVLISKDDAETIRKWNRENGMLDDWRVAFLTGVGTRIWPPIEKPVAHDGVLTVEFTAEMNGATITSPGTVWIESVTEADPKRIAVTIDEGQPLPSHVRDIRVKLPKELRPGGTYRLALGNGLRSANRDPDRGDPISPHPASAEALPKGVARGWQFQVDPIVHVYLRPVGLPEGAKLEAEIGGEWVEVQPTQLVSVPAGDLRMQVSMADGVFPQPALNVGSEGSYNVNLVFPNPVRIRGSAPAVVTVGEKGQIMLEALDSAGNPIAHHAPVELTLSATGGTVSPVWLFMTGKSTVEFTAGTPGRGAIRISAAKKDVECAPEISLLCRSPLSEQRDWSDEERYTSLAAEQGGRDIRISPRLRRWFAQSGQDETPKHRVKLSVDLDGDRRELSEVTTPPLQYEFKRDSQGFLYVSRNVGGNVILAYQYRRGRCGLLMTGDPGAAGSKELKSELERLLTRIGYECITDAELSAGLGADYVAGAAPTDAQAAHAISVLSLDDVFVAGLANRGRDIYELGWTIWTKGQSAPWSTQGQQVSSRQIRVGTQPGRIVDPKELRVATQRQLGKWLELVGIRFETESSGE